MLTRCFDRQFAGLYTHERDFIPPEGKFDGSYVRTLPNNMAMYFHSIWEVWNTNTGQLILMGIKSEEFDSERI